MEPGTIREWNQVVFGVDPVAVDVYGANLFGLKPAQIDYLSIAAQLSIRVNVLSTLRPLRYYWLLTVSGYVLSVQRHRIMVLLKRDVWHVGPVKMLVQRVQQTGSVLPGGVKEVKPLLNYNFMGGLVSGIYN